MAPKEDVQDIIQSFVDNDLASLDRIGGGSDSYTLSPHLAEPSPALTSPPERISSKTGPQIGGPTTTSHTAAASRGLPNGPVEHGDNGSLPANETAAPSEIHADPSSSSKNRRSAPDNLQSRHVSSSSTTSTSTLDHEKRASFGDKFKKFGKRITSSSKK